MKVRIIIAAAIAIMLAVAASSASGGTVGLKAGKSITVWLQTDASSSPAWLALTAATNAQFQKDHPGVDVNVQYQTWGSHLQKFDATLAGGNTPDVIEMGNTEMTKYMAAGAFQDLTAEKASFPNSSTWLKGLAASGVYNGKTYGVPYYAGSRLVTYRTDQYKAAGASSSPTSLAQLTSDLSKLNKKYGSKKGWSPLYIAGTDWYFALSFVYDFGGIDRPADQRQVEGHARVAQGRRRADRVQGVLQRRLARKQDDRRGASEPVRRLRAGPCGLDRRARAGSRAASARRTRLSRLSS